MVVMVLHVICSQDGTISRLTLSLHHNLLYHILRRFIPLFDNSKNIHPLAAQVRLAAKCLVVPPIKRSKKNTRRITPFDQRTKYNLKVVGLQ